MLVSINNEKKNQIKIHNLVLIDSVTKMYEVYEYYLSQTVNI